MEEQKNFRVAACSALSVAFLAECIVSVGHGETAAHIFATRLNNGEVIEFSLSDSEADRLKDFGLALYRVIERSK